jgi:hypothetical protein
MLLVWLAAAPMMTPTSMNALKFGIRVATSVMSGVHIDVG